MNIFWDERGSGPPVLLIMGLSFTHEMWFRILPRLSTKFRTIFFDNRGMGRSEVPRGPYRMQVMARDAVSVLDAAGVQAAHVVGASMGGMIAQELALRHPKRVLSLLLGCTSCGGFFSRWPSWKDRPRGVFVGATSRGQREAAFVPLLYSKSTGAELIAEDLTIRSRCTWTSKGFWGQLTGILLWNSYRRLPRIEVPTLVVHGDEDLLVPPSNGRAVAQRIPGAQFELIPKAGHVLTTDQPDACLDVMMRFLAQQER